jgi:hypothetical protein
LEHDLPNHPKAFWNIVAMLAKALQNKCFQMGPAKVWAQGGDHIAVGQVQTKTGTPFAAWRAYFVDTLAEMILRTVNYARNPIFV